LGNSFLPRELFAGSHPLLERGYGAMTVRFFMLQSHYSSTLDFSNEALSAAEKGFKKLTASLSTIKKLAVEAMGSGNTTISDELFKLAEECHRTMSDDFNTAKTLAVLFEMSSRINDMKSGTIALQNLDGEKFNFFKNTYTNMMEQVLGLREEEEHNHELLNGVIDVLIDLRKKARTDRNYALSDKIRDELKQRGIQIMDGKEGEMTWTID
jgi:cysteinyl-tRNA synthetase